MGRKGLVMKLLEEQPPNNPPDHQRLGFRGIKSHALCNFIVIYRKG